MILRSDSRLLKILLVLAFPSQRLPALLPLWVMQARVGSNTTDFVSVTFRKP